VHEVRVAPRGADARLAGGRDEVESGSVDELAGAEAPVFDWPASTSACMPWLVVRPLKVYWFRVRVMSCSKVVG